MIQNNTKLNGTRIKRNDILLLLIFNTIYNLRVDYHQILRKMKQYIASLMMIHSYLEASNAIKINYLTIIRYFMNGPMHHNPFTIVFNFHLVLIFFVLLMQDT